MATYQKILSRLKASRSFLAREAAAAYTTDVGVTTFFLGGVFYAWQRMVWEWSSQRTL